MSLKEFYENKVVLITGSCSGIGKELARQILSFNGKVVFTSRFDERLVSIENEFAQLKSNFMLHQGDIRDESNLNLLMEKIKTIFGRLDILICNAAISSFGDFDDSDSAVLKQVIDTNIYGSILPVKVFLPELKNSKGTIVFISSIAGIRGLPGYSAYSLSKMALTSLAQSLSLELKRHQVSVCIAYPGLTQNEESKRTIAPNGTLVQVPERPAGFVTPREKTARKILVQIMNKKFTKIHSILGLIIKYSHRFGPGLLHYLYQKKYKNGAGIQ